MLAVSLIPGRPQLTLLLTVAVARHWALGRRFGFPRCCIAMFCADQLAGWPAGSVRRNQTGYTSNPLGTFVPCGVVHAGDSTLARGTRVRRIARWWWLFLQPTSRGQGLRGAGVWLGPLHPRGDCPTSRWRPEELAAWIQGALPDYGVASSTAERA